MSEVPEPTKNEMHPPNKDAEIAYLKGEIELLKGQMNDAVEEWKNRAIKAEAIVRIIPRGEKECNLFTIYPKCLNCEKKIKYHIGFRGSVVGKLFGATAEEEVIKKVEEQGRILFEKENLPEGLGPDEGDKT